MLRSYMPHTMLFNLTGGPGISLPLHWSADGLPVGVQIAADIGNDAAVLKIAAQIESAYPWREHRPPVYFGSQSD
jgi:amidase